MTDHEDGPPMVPPPASYREEPTNPEASLAALRPSSVPPPPGAEYFDHAYRNLTAIHRQQMQAFKELHDPESRLNQNIELVLYEVRGVRRDFASIVIRTTKIEERMDAVERRSAKEESARHELEERVQALEARLDAALAAGALPKPSTR